MPINISLLVFVAATTNAVHERSGASAPADAPAAQVDADSEATGSSTGAVWVHVATGAALGAVAPGIALHGLTFGILLGLLPGLLFGSAGATVGAGVGALVIAAIGSAALVGVWCVLSVVLRVATAVVHSDDPVAGSWHVPDALISGVLLAGGVLGAAAAALAAHVTVERAFALGYLDVDGERRQSTVAHLGVIGAMVVSGAIGGALAGLVAGYGPIATLSALPEGE